MTTKDKYEEVKKAIQEIYKKNQKAYGYRRIALDLRSIGYKISLKTVYKLMKSLNIKGKKFKRKYNSYKGTVGNIAQNYLDRKFKAKEPMQKLVTDVTEFNVSGEKVYLSPILDLYNREIVSYNISTRPNFWQTRDMLEKFLAKKDPNTQAILHSDQGWQYQMEEYQSILKENNIIQSMSRKGNCLDNSVMENFFGRLKVEMFYGEEFESAEDLIKKVEEYIYYYNNERISLKLKMSPVQYRKKEEENKKD